MPSLFSIAGPIEVTIGCDGGTENNIRTYIIIAAVFLLAMCVLFDLDTCSNQNNKHVCKVARLLQAISTAFKCSVKISLCNKVCTICLPLAVVPLITF